MASRDSGEDAEPSPTLTVVRSGLAGILLVLALVSVCVAIGLLVLTTNGWTDVMESPLKSPLWALVPLPIAFFVWRAGIRYLRQPILLMDNDEVTLPASKGREELVLPFASITEVNLKGNHLKFKTVEDETEDGELTYGDFQASLFGVPVPRRRLVERAIQGKVKAWDEANE